jgi:hypothetical protein
MDDLEQRFLDRDERRYLEGTAMTYHNLNKVAVSMKDPCPHCGSREWRVVPTTVNERMNLRIGRHWLAQCESCQKEYVVLTHKQEKEAREKDARTKIPYKSFWKPATLPDPRLTLGGDCQNERCDRAFCPEHSEIDVWVGEELLSQEPINARIMEFWREQNGF